MDLYTRPMAHKEVELRQKTGIILPALPLHSGLVAVIGLREVTGNGLNTERDARSGFINHILKTYSAWLCFIFAVNL